MRRADRLFQIVQHLRAGRLVTADALATKLEVSRRTIYRDMADLQSTGVPIDGEAGLGYILRSGFDLPPLMFTRAEIVALVAGAKMVRTWGGQDMSDAAVEALVKIEAVLPDEAQRQVDRVKVFTPPRSLSPSVRAYIDEAEAAIGSRAVLRLIYRDQVGATTQRTVHPLGLWFWGAVWTLVAWCELRDDFRMFRLDRILELMPSGDRFEATEARSLEACLRQLRETGS